MNHLRTIFSLLHLFVVYSYSGDSPGSAKHKVSPALGDDPALGNIVDKSVQRHQSLIEGASVTNKGMSDFCSDDLSCTITSPNDKYGLEAIKSLHRQLDDDANGAVDLSESDDFLREELQYGSGAEKRQRAFHRNDDMHISVKELWEAWVRSEVHNWTVEQTAEWLAVGVGLPQYTPVFTSNGVDGATLPRLAVSNMQYLSNVLGIKDPIHKQKIALKAMDVVLFGPPKEPSNHVKDIILVTLLMAALIGFWYTYRMNKNSKKHLKRMMKDMESLQKAELALENLQKELERARQEQECAASQKEDLERKLLEHSDTSEIKSSCSDLELAKLRAENEMLRNELERAEVELKDRCCLPPPGLQQWLQLTHELENKSYIKKKMSAEKQLQSARDACEKLRKKRSSLVGAFVSTHGKSIDEVDRSIVEARTLLNEVTQELAERVHRWKKIEMLCGFNIINNRGLAVLESELYKGAANGRHFGVKGRLNSQDGLDEDSNSLADRGGDSSSSEKLEDDDHSSYQLSSPDSFVEFTVGEGNEESSLRVKSRKQHEWEKSSMSHSHSQEFSLESEGLGNVKLSHSDSNLESPVLPVIHPRHRRSGTSRSDLLATGASLDEEAYSTDSNSTAAEDFSSLDRSTRKNKLRFPKFRKSRHTPQPERYT